MLALFTLRTSCKTATSQRTDRHLCDLTVADVPMWNREDRPTCRRPTMPKKINVTERYVCPITSRTLACRHLPEVALAIF